MQKTVITDLILKCRQNDQHAFRKLVEMHQAMIFSFIFKMLCNEEEAKDAVQETFIKVWKHINKYNTELKFSTWLFAIASNLCCDKIKFGKRKFSFQQIDNENIFLSDENIEMSAINSDMAKIIITITDKLTPKQKLIFTLRDLEGLKVEKYKLLLVCRQRR